MKPPDGQSDQFVDRFPQAGLFLDDGLSSAPFARTLSVISTPVSISVAPLMTVERGHARHLGHFGPTAAADHHCLSTRIVEQRPIAMSSWPRSTPPWNQATEGRRPLREGSLRDVELGTSE